MRELKEARVAICKCTRRERIYGVRMERSGKDWIYNWAFEMNPDAARRENYDTTKVEGMLIRDKKYPGCPYCGTNAFIICGKCGKLSCNNTSSSVFKCGWCGYEGELSDYEGDGFSFNSNNDR